MHENRFPNEDDKFREARNSLLKAEVDLRKNIESVASLRRELPLGGELKEDYVFYESKGKTKFSELFESGKDTLLVYNFMYGPEAEKPCPACTSVVEGFNSFAPQLTQKVNFVVVGKSPFPRLKAWADKRGWNNIRFLSSSENTYNKDYYGEMEGFGQSPMLNVFTNKQGKIHHFWASELFFEGWDGGHPRHVDLLWPVWNLLDLTPGGRGNWFPQVS